MPDYAAQALCALSLRVRRHFVRHNQPESSDASGAMILFQVKARFREDLGPRQYESSHMPE